MRSAGTYLYGRRMYETWTQMSAFLKAGLIDVRPVITHRVPFESFESGIEAIKSGRIKVEKKSQ